MAAAAAASLNAVVLNPKATNTLSSSLSTNTRLHFPLRHAHWRDSATSTNATAGRLGPVHVAEEDDEDHSGDFIRRLQNGPDVRGVALSGQNGCTVDLTPAAVEAIAQCFGEWMAERKVGRRLKSVVRVSVGRDPRISGPSLKSVVRVSVGRDPRISGPSLCVAVFTGLRKAGCEVFDMGLATTPACFMSTVLRPFEYDASIMLTASHLPYTRNGLKFFTKDGGLRPDDVEQICDRAARTYELAKMSIDKCGDDSAAPPATSIDFMSTYSRHLRDIIKDKISHPQHYHTPLLGFKVIVNAGNGSGGFFASDVLEKLGADTTGSLHLDPDGMFPNHVPNPEDSTTMSLTANAVLRHGADLGVVFDTDVDRSAVVGRSGGAINGDRLIALMSAIILRERPGTTVVTDARTSPALTRFITAAGGRHCMYRVGYRNVIDKGVQLNRDGVETHLMMETTGHGALKENYFLDDGAYIVVKIIIEMVGMKLEGSEEGIERLIKDLEDPVDSVELRMKLVAQPKYAKEKAAEAVEAFRSCIQEGKLRGWELDSCGDCWVYDGCLVDSNNTPAEVDAHMYRSKVSNEEHGQYGWLHIRQSVHSPTIVVNIQSSVAGGCQTLAAVFRDDFLLACGLEKMLDISQVDNYARRGVSAEFVLDSYE